MIILREQKKRTKNIEYRLWNEISTDACGESNAVVGIAVDIGTTVIAMTAVALQDGRIIGERSETNEQTGLGAEVMMRIMHSLGGKGEKLHQMVVCQIERMAKQILDEGLSAENVIEDKQIRFLVVGNTTMCHLFLDRSVEGLAGYPFRADYEGNYRCMGREIGMKIFRDTQIDVLSGIAAHVGADALAVIGAEKLFEQDKIQLAVDLGTNAEIILNYRGRLSVCSTAAGPAFEGKGINCGMAAKAGAVNGVKISPGNGNIILEFISGDVPRGICGSGLVDAIAGLRKCGVLGADGYLISRQEAENRGIHPAICGQMVERNGQNSFLFYSDREGGDGIYLQQSDIRSIQLAKAGVQAGITSILCESGIELSKVDEVVVAGVLGSCMRPANAVAVGLLPGPGTECLRFVGNAAGRGAVRALTDVSFLSDMERLAEEICHVELAEIPQFGERLVRAMELKPWP